jgi:hypothetical protein
MAEPALLDLLTTQTRPVAKIDGREYDIRTSNDLTLFAYKRFQKLSPLVGELLLKDDMTAEDGDVLTRHLDEACRLILDAPDEVQKRLGDVNRLTIFGVFTDLLTPSLTRTRASSEASSEPGTTSSPGSPGSTPAPARSNGARKSRSGRSKRT